MTFYGRYTLENQQMLSKYCLSFYDQIQGRCEPFRQSQTENLSLLPHSVAHSHVTLCMSHYSLIKILTEIFDIYVKL